MATLVDYQNDTAYLIRDTQNLFLPLPQLTRYINEARRQVAYQTGCLRFLVTGQAPFGTTAQPGVMVPGGFVPGMLPGNAIGASTVQPGANLFQTINYQERYDYEFANRFLRKQVKGVQGVMDVVDLAVSWGSIRPALSWIPWDDLQAYARSYNVGVTSYPFYWSTIDGENGQVWLFPYPTLAMEMEWDCLCVPKNLQTQDDWDIIPPGFQNAVKYYAAHLAYLYSQRQASADVMLQGFARTLGISNTSANRGKTPSFYWASEM